MTNIEALRTDFPILNQEIKGKPLAYLDNAATTQKPTTVLKALEDYYLQDNANVHRGVHTLSERATLAYEQARKKIQNFINAKDSAEIIFTKGTTEAINLVAHSYGLPHLQANDEILISTLEHHANIVPWQEVCKKTGAILKVIPITDNGDIIYDEFLKLLTPKTKLLAINHISNALGTINPIAEMIKAAHANGTLVLIDGAQAIAHTTVDVQALDCDFYCFSGHKIYAPTGIGVLYGKKDLLNNMPPYQTGGEMIATVSFEKTTFNQLPNKFEAGTPNIAGAIALGAAIDYLNSIGLEKISAYEHELYQQLLATLTAIPDVKIIGAGEQRSGAVSFMVSDIHPHDVGTILDQQGVAIRAGHHCTMPLMQRLQVPATARASVSFYNNQTDIAALGNAIETVRSIFA